MPDSTDTLAIGWCDPGTTDGKFTEGLVYTLLNAPAVAGIAVQRAIRVQGNQIARQRQALFDLWADRIGTDWLLWVDADIALTVEALQTLWRSADALQRPVLAGTYFVLREHDAAPPMPVPALFDETADGYAYRHPLPHDTLLRVDAAGFGLVLMHRGIVPLLRARHPPQELFAEAPAPGARFGSEDLMFCRRLKAAGIPLHAHTGALVQHVKRFALDAAYYRMYWAQAQPPAAPAR